MTEAVFGCDTNFDPNKDQFTLEALLRIIAPLFAVCGLLLLLTNIALAFFVRKKYLLGIALLPLAVIIQFIAWQLLIVLDPCLIIFAVVSIIQAVVLFIISIVHLARVVRRKPHEQVS